MSEKITVLVDGGKASAGPPIGSTLGPKGINVSQVVSDINKKTDSFKGMKVPVNIIIEKDKSYKIEVGTPPVSELIKKEINAEKGSGTPNINKIGNLGIEQAIKVAKMKYDSMFVKDLKAAVKSVIGSANSAGILTEGMSSLEVNKLIDSGKFDNEIKNELIELSEEKKQKLDEQLTAIQELLKKELEKQKALEEAEKAKEAKPEAEVKEEKVEGKEEKKDVKEEVKGKEVKAKEPVKETKAKETKGKEAKK
ncbi:50S ribosomal protein L11 [Candidatus Woesearchaeota archaeon]|nr:50S ribosomal protein L11 [Candidatus Woesearchaeota archaeon]